ncbi:hypothetical protein L195_g042972, partial [Trifolium pratense]
MKLIFLRGLFHISNPQTQMGTRCRVQVLEIEQQARMRWWWRLKPTVTRVAQLMVHFPPLSFVMSAFKDFSILAWNVRGFASRKSKNHVHDLIRRFKPDIVFLFETHTMFATANSYWDRENYVRIDIQEVLGHSGGIWAMQRRGSDFNFTLVSKMHQCVSFIVTKGTDKWLCSGVYASPICTLRPLLWDYLEDLVNTVSLPVLAIGDFNDILLPNEQKGGVFSLTKADTFSRNVDNCGLIDLGSFGTKFTWQGNCRGGRIVHRRLDRSFCNHEWRLKFPEATVEHLVRKHSDHNPILLRCHNAMVCQESRPFRFQAAWFTHSDYPILVRNTWARDRNNIVDCLQNVAQESTIFNKEVFDSANLLRLQKELLTSYDNILFQEETLWYQKSREQWIKLGSRNTSFFHAQTIIRRKRNKIHGIRLSSGEWCTDPDIMKTEALKFFKDLFCDNQAVSRGTNDDEVSALDDVSMAELSKPVTKKEVFDALM